MKIDKKALQIALIHADLTMEEVSVELGMGRHWLSHFVRNSLKRKPFLFAKLEQVARVAGMRESELVKLED